jgi:4-hydroxybenzoyl-CoA thioesterase
MSASRKHIHRHRVAFGDCDPAQIVFYPNYFKWFDTASLEFFRACGVPPWRELEAGSGIIGTPLVKASAKFLAPASYGDDLDIEISIAEWRHKSFVMKYTIRRGDTVIAEGEETRVFAIRDAENPGRIKAVAIPAEIKALCEAAGEESPER